MKAAMKASSSCILVLIATVSLGSTTGFLTGQSGVDSTVLAAVLPAIITGGGWALLVYHLRRGGESGGLHKNRERALVSGMVVLFSVSLILGAHSGLYVKELYDVKNYNRLIQYEDRHRQKRRRILLECLGDELVVNDARRALGMEPLPPDVICPSLAKRQRD